MMVAGEARMMVQLQGREQSQGKAHLYHAALAGKRSQEEDNGTDGGHNLDARPCAIRQTQPHLPGIRIQREARGRGGTKRDQVRGERLEGESQTRLPREKGGPGGGGGTEGRIKVAVFVEVHVLEEQHRVPNEPENEHQLQIHRAVDTVPVLSGVGDESARRK